MGLFERLANATTSMMSGDLMESLSLQNGWTPDMKLDGGIANFFKGDAITPRRDVVVAHRSGNSLATFSCACRGRFNARTMTTAQLALFLARNDESVFGKWQITIEDGVVSAALRYTALVGGLDAESFKTISLSLLREVAFIEEALHGQGLL